MKYLLIATFVLMAFAVQNERDMAVAVDLDRDGLVDTVVPTYGDYGRYGGYGGYPTYGGVTTVGGYGGYRGYGYGGLTDFNHDGIPDQYERGVYGGYGTYGGYAPHVVGGYTNVVGNGYYGW